MFDIISKFGGCFRTIFLSGYGCFCYNIVHTEQGPIILMFILYVGIRLFAYYKLIKYFESWDEPVVLLVGESSLLEYPLLIFHR